MLGSASPEDLSAIGLLPLGGQIVLFIVYLLAALVTIVSTILTTKSDPTDPTVAEERNFRLNGSNSINRFTTAEFEFFCAVCNTHVLEDSKHCKMCNRCT